MPNRRCVILCGGPSVGDHDLTRIDCDVIGTNLSYLALVGRFHVFTYGKLMKLRGREIVEKTALSETRFSAVRLEGCFRPAMLAKYCRTEWRREERLPRLPDDYDVFRDGWIIAGGGPCALQVAVSCGYEEVVFVGLDLNVRGGFHFYPEEEMGAARSGQHYVEKKPKKQAFRVQEDFFAQFLPELERRGIKAWNTSLRSSEQTFEKREFDSLWG
ncbi:MAG: hypothetical protein GY769_07690 [bacterium]|nr:hypothetical protein [bacterium]